MENKFIVFKFDKKRAFGYVAAVLLPILTGILSSVLTDFSPFSKLESPPLTPSVTVFTLVWSALYVFIGTASFLIWRETERFTPKKPETSLIYYFIMLVVAFLWPILFFNLGMYLLAAAWLVILIGLTALVTVKFGKIYKTAGFLMLPMLVWLLYSLYLNIGFLVVN